MNSPHRDQQNDPAPAQGTPSGPVVTAEDKRVAARRRFLKMGAGGSTAMVVTIMHKRAFAGGTTIKKGAIVSACVSLQGVPDMKGFDQKKALQMQVSVLGKTPKGVMCRPRPATNNCVANKTSKFFDADGLQHMVVSNKQIAHGCGNLDDTLRFQYDFRLYEKGYCPIKTNANGDLVYETGLPYFEEAGCKVGDIKDAGKPNEAVCVQIGLKPDGKPRTFWQRNCE